jgi:hypothetical protein
MIEFALLLESLAMKHATTLVLVIAVLSCPVFAAGKRAAAAPVRQATSHKAGTPRAKSGSARVTSTSKRRTASKRGTAAVRHRPAACASCARDDHGRIKRSSSARTSFQRSNPCPSTGRRTGRCPGYVIDHVTPLKRGGADHPDNMQWQTVAAAKQKDKIE